MNIIKTLKFIERARNIHNNLYGYSQVKFIHCDIKIVIDCYKHGPFEQNPSAHLRGQGCSKCQYEKKSLTTEEFIQRAIAIHGDKFNYSKVNYINSNNSIIIICPIHGEFEQLPYRHLEGYGCRKCWITDKSLTLEQFIEKARKVHGDKFDYSKVVYINAITKIIIICPIHGEFDQIPNGHLTGRGCLKCKYEKSRLIIKEFIKKAIAIHGDKYDYSEVNYINAHSKVTIICHEHGEFQQTPNSHLAGSSCFKCDIANRSLTLKEFIEKAEVVHSNRYNYDNSKYINSITKIEIECYKHGPFEQIPNSHLQGTGCPKCAIEIIINKKRLTLKEFIEKAIDVHGDIYNYEKVRFIDVKTKVTINCYKHGPFEQTPRAHLSNQGCPICKSSKGELTIRHILRKHKIKYRRQYLIPQIANKLYYDFYLPKYKLLIEFHGKQHYEYVPFFHDNDEGKFLDQKTRDAVKKSNARDFRYRFIEFNYKQLKYLTKEQFEELVLRKIKIASF